MNFQGAVIAGAVEVPYRRKAAGVTTTSLLGEAFVALIAATGLSASKIDGLAVASFTLKPDHAIDMAWRLGISPRWIMEDTNGGASGINMLQHAARAVQCGDASAIAILAGDHFTDPDFADLIDNYNATTRDYLAPLPFGGPSSLFSFVTQAQMRKEGLDRADYGRVCISQREWASLNPGAVYRNRLTLNDYLSAPIVASPLGRFDCVPVVSGANAILVTRPENASRCPVAIRAIRGLHNYDNHSGDGLKTGLALIADLLWSDSGRGPEDMDAAYVYDDYPVMVLAQLQDLGLMGAYSMKDFIRKRLATRELPVNTSGGQLSAGQAGAAGGLHGLVEAVKQLRHEAGERQIARARHAVVSGYGMIEYRYCLCANAAVLEATT
ncbi:MAG: thiolase family protein [Xanthobacteraceae bacterium]